MSRPLWTVRYIRTEAELPEKLERGRAYFVADEQCIIIDMYDGRGPVRYGDKPGPQGMAGEPIPSLQGQIDELAEASLATTATIHDLNMKRRADYEHIEKLLVSQISGLKENDSQNAEAIMTLLLLTHEKFTNYDAALGIIAQTLAKLYPSHYGAAAGDGSNTITTGEIITSNGTSFKVDESYYDGNTGVVVLTVYDTKSPLKAGDKVEIDSGYFIVDSISNSGNTGIIQLTLYYEGEA